MTVIQTPGIMMTIVKAVLMKKIYQKMPEKGKEGRSKEP